LIAGILQRERKALIFYPVMKAALAVFMAVLLLGTVACASMPALHHLLHADATGDDHGCAVCLLAHGQFSSPVSAVSVATLVFSQSFLVFPPVTVVRAQAVDRLGRSRAPPAPF
jgi:hypothetical protein